MHLPPSDGTHHSGDLCAIGRPFGGWWIGRKVHDLTLGGHLLGGRAVHRWELQREQGCGGVLGRVLMILMSGE
jgi:hypothetical protein